MRKNMKTPEKSGVFGWWIKSLWLMETGLSQEPLLPLPSTHLCQAKGRKDSCGTSEHKFQPLFNHLHDSKAPKPQGNSSPPYHFPSLVTHIPLIFQSYPSRKPP
jgi:hypothetical protein